MTDIERLVISSLIGGTFSLVSAWYVFSTQNEKVRIDKRHEIALTRLIPNLYDPLLNSLNEYELKVKLGSAAQFDIRALIHILTSNTTWILFTPNEIQVILKNISGICCAVNRKPSDQDIKTQDELIKENLNELRNKLQERFSKYVL